MDDNGYKTLVEAYNDPAQASKRDRIAAVITKAGRQLPGAAAGGGPPELAAKRKALTYAEQVAATHDPGEGSASDPQHEDDVSEGDVRLGQFNDRLQTMGRGVVSVAKALRHPIDTAQNDAKVRQFVRGGSDMFLGYPVKIADAIHASKGRGHPFADIQAEDQVRAPDERTGGALVTSLLPNPFGLAARAAGAGVGAVAGKLPGAPTAAGGALRGLATYEAVAPGMAALHTDSAGHRAEAAKEAATDPLGLLMSGFGGGMGGGGRGKAAKIRNPKFPSGRVIQDVQNANAKIKMFGDNPVQGGLYESPEMRNLGRGREGVNELAGQSVNRIREANQSRLSSARSQYGEQLDNVILGHGEAPHPTTNAHAALDAMEAENTVKAGRPDAEIGDAGVHNAIGKVRRMLSQTVEGTDDEATLKAFLDGLPPKERIADKYMTPALRKVFLEAAKDQGKGIAGPGQMAQQVTAQDMVKTRKLVRQLANNAATPSENRVYEKVLGAMDEDAAAIDPRIRQMNAEFAKAMVPIETSNDMVFGKRAKDFDMNEAARTTGVQRIGTMTDDTQSGTNRALANRLSAVGPEYKREVDLMLAKKAQERLRRGEPQVSTAMEKQGDRAARQVGSGKAIGALLAGIPGIMLGYGIDKARENPFANQVRVTLPIAEKLGKLNGSSGVATDAITGVARRRGKKKKGAEMSTGGATD